MVDDAGCACICDPGSAFVIGPSEVSAGGYRWIAPDVINPSEDIQHISGPLALFPQTSNGHLRSSILPKVVIVHTLFGRNIDL